MWRSLVTMRMRSGQARLGEAPCTRTWGSCAVCHAPTTSEGPWTGGRLALAPARTELPGGGPSNAAHRQLTSELFTKILTVNYVKMKCSLISEILYNTSFCDCDGIEIFRRSEKLNFYETYRYAILESCG